MNVPGWLKVVLGILLILVAVGVVLYLVRQRAGEPAAPPPTADWYDIYFTEPTYPDRPDTRRGGIDERFVQFVDSASRSLDVAIYDFDLQNVAEAMARAQQRGVRVRMVTDSDTPGNTRDQEIQRAFATLRQAGIPIVEDERRAIMHHKFAVRDGEELWTGSWNMTVGDTYRLNNNAVRIRSSQLATVFTGEFERMFVQRLFGGNKPKGSPAPPVQIGDARIQALFSPSDGVTARIGERVDQARSQVHFMAFSFTADGIARTLVERSEAGVAIAGIFERTGSETRFSEFGPLSQAGLEVYQDGNPYAMHHKVFVVDGRTAIFGSFNFSDSAERENDENCLIVDDAGFAAAFEQEFTRILTAARNPAAQRQTPERERPR